MLTTSVRAISTGISILSIPASGQYTPSYVLPLPRAGGSSLRAPTAPRSEPPYAFFRNLPARREDGPAPSAISSSPSGSGSVCCSGGFTPPSLAPGRHVWSWALGVADPLGGTPLCWQNELLPPFHFSEDRFDFVVL
jgi:hypothetical protein